MQIAQHTISCPSLALSTTGTNVVARTNGGSGYTINSSTAMNLSIPQGTKFVRVLAVNTSQPCLLRIRTGASTYYDYRKFGSSSISPDVDVTIAFSAVESSGGYPQVNVVHDDAGTSQLVFVHFYS